MYSEMNVLISVVSNIYNLLFKYFNIFSEYMKMYILTMDLNKTFSFHSIFHVKTILRCIWIKLIHSISTLQSPLIT